MSDGPIGQRRSMLPSTMGRPLSTKSSSPALLWRILAALVALMALPSCYLWHARDDGGGADGGVGDAPPAVRAGPWFAYFVDGSDGTEPRVEAVRLGGSRPITVMPAAAVQGASWSPTGATLALFTSSGGGEETLSILQFGEEGPSLVWRGDIGESALELTWSPSGRYLAWYARRAGYVLDTTNPSTVIDLPHHAGGVELRWSVNDVLAVSWRYDEEAWIGILREGWLEIPATVALPDGAEDAELDDQSEAWSPDGSRLLFAAHDRSIPFGDVGVRRVYATTDHGEPATAVSVPVTTRHASPSHARWSPDGRFVLYDETEPSSDGHTLTRGAYVAALDGSPAVRVGANAMGERMVWTADNQLVAIESEGPSTEVVRITTDEGAVERVVRYSRMRASAAPVLAPGGDRGVVLFLGSPATAALWDVAAGDVSDLLTRESIFLDGDGWSPDGTRFVLVADFALWELDAVGAEVRMVTDEARRFGSETAAPWSPGSEGYFFFRPDGGVSLRDTRSERTYELTRGSTRVIGWQRNSE